MKTLLCASVITAALASPASAITGAELLQSDARYARGYLWGALTSYLLLVSPDSDDENERTRAKRLSCLQTANINDNTFHQAVVGYIDRNPRALTEEVLGPMIRTLIEMCDEKS